MNNNHGNRRRGCGCMKMARGYWNSFPYYSGPCPNEDGCYRYDRDDDNDDDRNHGDRCDRRDWDDRNGCRRRGHRGGRDHDHGVFAAYLPVAVSANGIVPLTVNNPCRKPGFDVNSGLITLKNGGTYLAIYTVQVPGAAALDTTVTLNVDGASQSTAAVNVVTVAGDATSSYTGQAIFEASDGATVSLRSSEAINVTDPAAQPMFVLSLLRLED